MRHVLLLLALGVALPALSHPNAETPPAGDPKSGQRPEAKKEERPVAKEPDSAKERLDFWKAKFDNQKTEELSSMVFWEPIDEEATLFERRKFSCFTPSAGKVLETPATISTEGAPPETLKDSGFIAEFGLNASRRVPFVPGAPGQALFSGQKLDEILTYEIRKTPQNEIIIRCTRTVEHLAKKDGKKADETFESYCVARPPRPVKEKFAAALDEFLTNLTKEVPEGDKLARDIRPLLHLLADDNAEKRRAARNKLAQKLKGADATGIYRLLDRYATHAKKLGTPSTKKIYSEVNEVLKTASPDWEDVIGKIKAKVETDSGLKKQAQFLVQLTRARDAAGRVPSGTDDQHAYYRKLLAEQKIEIVSGFEHPFLEGTIKTPTGEVYPMTILGNEIRLERDSPTHKVTPHVEIDLGQLISDVKKSAWDPKEKTTIKVNVDRIANEVNPARIDVLIDDKLALTQLAEAYIKKFPGEKAEIEAALKKLLDKETKRKRFGPRAALRIPLDEEK